jgi:simple sugar transport system substrate-binding protein
MKLKSILAAAATAATLATGVAAQDIAVIAGSVEDAFMDKIKKGVDDATAMVTLNGGTVQYLRTQNYENFGPDLVTLINQAVAQGVDGIAIPIWVPDAQIPALQAARDAHRDHAVQLGSAGHG